MPKIDRFGGGAPRSSVSTFTHQQNIEHITRGAYFSSLASVSQAQAGLTALLEAVEGDLNEITYQNARRLYFLIQQRVPYRTGRLAESVRVDRVLGTGGKVYGFRAYAFAVNPETGEEYAVEQHENTRYKHAPGRTDHYISIPFEQVIKLIERELEDNARTIVKRMNMDQSERNRVWRRDPNPEAFRSYFSNLKNLPHKRGSVNFGGSSGSNWSNTWKRTTEARFTKYTKGSKRSGYKKG